MYIYVPLFWVKRISESDKVDVYIEQIYTIGFFT